MEQFCHTLLTMDLTAAIAAVVVLLVRLALKKAPRWLTCLLYLAVLFRMVCPVGLPAPVSLMPQTVPQVSQLVLPATPVTQDAASQAPVAPTAPPVTADGGTAAPTTEPVETAPAAFDWPRAVTTVWAIGTAAVLLHAGISYVRLRRRVAEAVRVEEGVYETDAIDTPFLCGILRPRIYLPVGLAEPDRRYVLLHERAHLARFDHVTKPLAYLALAVHWFDPILWLTYRTYCRDVEMACDQRVVRLFDRADTAGYGAALLHLGRRTPLPAMGPLAFSEGDTGRRIAEVLRYKRPIVWMLVLAAAVVAVVVGLLAADPTERHGPQLQGAPIAQAWAIGSYDVAALPDDLRDDLVKILKPAVGATQASARLSELGQGKGPIVRLTTEAGTTVYYLARTAAGEYQLARSDRDSYADPELHLLALADGTAEVLDAWFVSLDDYLRVGRADAFYDEGKLPYIGDNSAVVDLLQRLTADSPALADRTWTAQLQTATEPYGVTIVLVEGAPLPGGEERFGTYCDAVGRAFLALVANAGTVTWTCGDWSTTVAYDPAETPDLKTIDRDGFRALYAEMKAAEAVCAAQAGEGSTEYVFDRVLFAAPSQGLEPEQTSGSVTLTGQGFIVSLSRPEGTMPTWGATLAGTGTVPGGEQKVIAPSGEVLLQFRQDASASYDYLSYRTSEGDEYRLYGDGAEPSYLVHVYREDGDTLTVDLMARIWPAPATTRYQIADATYLDVALLVQKKGEPSPLTDRSVLRHGPERFALTLDQDGGGRYDWEYVNSQTAEVPFERTQQIMGTDGSMLCRLMPGADRIEAIYTSDGADTGFRIYRGSDGAADQLARETDTGLYTRTVDLLVTLAAPT